MSGNTHGRVLKGEMYAHSVQKSRFSFKTEEKSCKTALYIKAKRGNVRLYVMMPGIRLKFLHRSTMHEALDIWCIVTACITSSVRYPYPIRARISYELTM